MNRAVWLIVIAVVIIAGGAFWLASAQRQSRVDDAIAKAEEISDSRARIAALVAIAQDGRDLRSESVQAISDGIASVAYEMGQADGLVAVCDSLLALDLPQELKYRLTSELHNGVVIQGYYSDDKAPYWKRASEIARGLLEADGVPKDVYMQVASFHGYALDFVPPEVVIEARDQWTPYEVAAKGFDRIEGPVTTSDTAILSSALGWALSRTSAAFGVDRAIAVTDSLLAEGPCPSMRAVILQQKYRVAADADPDLAVAAAKEVLKIGKRQGLWPILSSLSMDMSDRGLAPETALGLANAAIEFADTRSDSGRVYFAIGLAEKALSNLDESASALEKAVDRSDETPQVDDPRVDTLLTVYEESSRPDAAIDLLARLLARSVLPNEDTRKRLADLLEKEGRSDEEIPSLIESQRYVGVAQAPDFTLVDRDGNDVTLSDLRGNVVMLCFWSYG